MRGRLKRAELKTNFLFSSALFRQSFSPALEVQKQTFFSGSFLTLKPCPSAKVPVRYVKENPKKHCRKGGSRADNV
jgi:hypothetical protein